MQALNFKPSAKNLENGSSDRYKPKIGWVDRLCLRPAVPSRRPTLLQVGIDSGTTVLWAECYGYNAAGQRIYTLKGTTGIVRDAYGSALGRFVQNDSIDFAGGDSNLYRYVANNPVNYVDPLGNELMRPQQGHQLDPGIGGTAPMPGSRWGGGPDDGYTPRILADPCFRFSFGAGQWALSWGSMISGATFAENGAPFIGYPLIGWGLAGHASGVYNMSQGVQGHGFVSPQ